MRQLLWVWMLLMALAFVNDRCHCCLQEERSGLLEIKAWFTHAGDGSDDLRGWDKDDLNCCNWDYRVACDSTTSRVIKLYLFGVNDGALGKDLYLNASLFLPFNELEYLDLSQNHLVCGLKNQGFQGLASGLRKLKDLRLSNNKFNDNILSSLSGFSTLESLALSDNSFTGTIGLNGLRKLEVLYLESSDFKENILLESLGGLPSLKTLYARESIFNGKHFGKALQNLTKLEELFLDDASPITTSFLRIIGSLPALRNVSLEACMLSGTLPHQGMLPRVIQNSSTFLEEIDLSRNHFEGTIPIEYFNSYGLVFLDLSENNLSGSLPLGYYAPSLSYVHLYRNQLSGPLPYAFCNLSSLETLDLDDNNLTGPIPDWIDSLSELSIFDLKSNQFKGELPRQLCFLRRLSILDLSENNFSGHLPSCLSNFNFTTSYDKTFVAYSTTSKDEFDDEVFHFDSKTLWAKIDLKIAIELTSKKNFYPYMGDVLRYMSAVDLSCNRFTGEIPTEWGNLSGILSLNLSKNNLNGLIPSSFSNLKQIESLDLSHNNLNGRIPAQLIELTFLAVFNVSYNNLSGKTPERKYQFGTFDESSYKGNPLLCGPPLGNSCDKTKSPLKRVPDNSNGDDGSIDMDSFYVSFGVCYIIVVLTILAVLCINPHWRRRWFYFIEECIDTCYCVLVINFRKFFKSRR